MQLSSTTRRRFLQTTGLAAAALTAPAALVAQTKTQNRLNLLLITADDLNCSSVGAFGCKVKDTTPNIDKLAADGIRFVLRSLDG